MKKLILLSGLDGTGRLFQPFIEAFPSNIEAVDIFYPNGKKSKGFSSYSAESS